MDQRSEHDVAGSEESPSESDSDSQDWSKEWSCRKMQDLAHPSELSGDLKNDFYSVCLIPMGLRIRAFESQGGERLCRIIQLLFYGMKNKGKFLLQYFIHDCRSETATALSSRHLQQYIPTYLL